jgi:hypothetical protein
MKKYLKIGLIIIAVYVAACALYIIFLSIRFKDDIQVVSGKCVYVHGHGKPSYDIGIGLENNKEGFYINRGEQYAAPADSFKAQMLNKDVTLFVRCNFMNVNIGHIEKILKGDTVLWNEDEVFAVK